MMDAIIRIPQRVLMGLIKAYRLLLSPSLGSACRFELPVRFTDCNPSSVMAQPVERI